MQTEPLSDNAIRDFRALARCIIPPNAAYNVPGADDDLIFADILRSLDRDRDHVRQALAQLAKLSGGSFAALDGPARDATAKAFKAVGGSALAALVRVVLFCYYRDDRVMHSLGQEPRSPFPKGHVVEQGDWSLLDPVRARPPFYRRVG